MAGDVGRTIGAGAMAVAGFGVVRTGGADVGDPGYCRRGPCLRSHCRGPAVRDRRGVLCGSPHQGAVTD